MKLKFSSRKACLVYEPVQVCQYGHTVYLYAPLKDKKKYCVKTGRFLNTSFFDDNDVNFFDFRTKILLLRLGGA